MSNPAPSRGFFGYGCDALAGIVSALILACALQHPGSVFVLLAYLCALPLFIVGFSAGLISSLIASLCGVVAIFATGPLGVGVFYLFAYALPAIGLVYFSLRHKKRTDDSVVYTKTGDLLVALVLYPAILFLVVYAQMASLDGGLLGATHRAFEGLQDQINDMLAQSGQKATPEQTVKIHDMLDLLAKLAPAFSMGAWLIATGLTLGVAQAFVQKQGRALRPAFSLSQLRIPRWFTLIALVSVAGIFAPAPINYVALNLAIVFVLPFFFTGLAVIHARAASLRAPTLFLIAFYVVTAVIPQLAALVVLLGAADQWVDFRKRFAEKAVTLNTNQGERND